jgi:hypothetical protein
MDQHKILLHRPPSSPLQHVHNIQLLETILRGTPLIFFYNLFFLWFFLDTVDEIDFYGDLCYQLP